MANIPIPILAGLGTATNIAAHTTLDGELAFGTDTHDLYVRYSGTVYTVGGGGSSPLTTKGDLWGYSTTDARLAVGSNGKVLTADSTATLGVSWQTPSASGAGGSGGDVQFNNGTGGFSANGNLHWNDASQSLSIVTTSGNDALDLSDGSSYSATFVSSGIFAGQLTDGTRTVTLCNGSISLTVSDGTITVNGVAYLWPNSQVAGVLIDDGSGNLSWGVSPYTAGNAGDWASTAPADVGAALDRLAAAVAGLLGTAIP